MAVSRRSARYLVLPFRCVDARGAACGHAPDAGCLRLATLFGVLLCLPTAPGLPLQGHGDFGTSAFFGQPSDKPVLARIRSHGVRGAKRNGWSKIKR